MSIDKSLLAGSTSTLLLKLLEERDMYGYEIIEVLSKRSENIFNLKAGTLYPILHTLEKNGYVESYEQKADNDRMRKYYHITKNGIKQLLDRKKEWKVYSSAVENVLSGGISHDFI